MNSTLAEQPMAFAIRDVRDCDLDVVLTLNNAAGPNIFALDKGRLHYFFEYANYFRVAEVDGQLAGFLIALGHGTTHQSPNYRWFSKHYEDFVYIDRIVIASPYRGHGLGRIFYCDVSSYAEVRAPLLTCEVLLEPYDTIVVLFHNTFGFQEVGQQYMNHRGPPVSLLAKVLPSYGFVRKTYLEHGGLPAENWLAERQLSRIVDNKQYRLTGEKRP